MRFLRGTHVRIPKGFPEELVSFRRKYKLRQSDLAAMVPTLDGCGSLSVAAISHIENRKYDTAGENTLFGLRWAMSTYKSTHPKNGNGVSKVDAFDLESEILDLLAELDENGLALVRDILVRFNG